MTAARQARSLACAAALVATAWVPLAAQRLPVTRFGGEEGLPASQVWHVLEDRRGYLWIATTWGLARYDGRQFSSLSVPEGLPSANVRLSLEDPSGDLWIGTNGGLARYDGRSVVSYADRGGALAATVWAAGVDRYGVAWFGTDQGLVAASGGDFRTYGKGDGLADDYVYALHLSRDGAIWLGSRGSGVTRCSVESGGRLGACRTFGEAEGLRSGAVRAIAEDSSGTLYFATRGAGLARFAGRRFEHLPVTPELPAADLYALLIDRDGRLLVGSTDHGLSICSLPGLDPCHLVTEANGLADNSVRALLEDREGTLWIGSESGLAEMARRDVWSYGISDGLPDPQVYALAPYGEHGVWVGTFGGLARLDVDDQGRPHVETWGPERGLPAKWVWALDVDRQGDLWVGTEAGVARLASGRVVEVYRHDDGLAGDYVTALTEDRQGDLWVAAIGGLSRLRRPAGGGRAEIARFGVAEGLARARCYAVAEDALGRIWVAHGEGLSRSEGDRFEAVTSSAGLDLRAARTLGRGRDGALWVGGYGQLARLLDGAGPPRFRVYRERSGLAGVLVLTIAEDGHGHLLLGTNRGVLLFDPAARQGEGAVLARFGRANGLPTAEVPHSGAFTWGADGRGWFGFKAGLSAFPRDFEPTRSAPPKVDFERLETGLGRFFSAPFASPGRPGEALTPRGARLAHGDRDLRVVVRAQILAGERELRFQYQLAGLEQEWGEPVPEPFRYYTNLDPGSYRLRARAALAGGAWGEPAELAIEIAPAWHQTPWARALLAALAALGIYGGVHLRTRSVERRNRELARGIAERTDDLARYARALEEHVEALDRANERIRAADRYRAEFLAKMSHELRTPLTSVLGFAALLGDGLADRLEPRHARYLANIRESGNHLLRLINNLLDQAKIEAGGMDLHLEPSALDEIAESAAGLMEGYAATRGVELELRHLAAVPPILVDVAKLRQIAINLLSNAIKFSPSGSRVVVTTRPLAADASPLGLDSYELSVSDQGPGVALEDRERIFEPFHQLGTRGGTHAGTGLGLSIVRQFVALHGGTVEVLSPVAGAVFRVVLPVDASGRAEGEGRRGTARAATPGDLPRVVVLEPDRGRFTALAADLDREGLLAVRAPDLEEAKRMLRELRPALVALDLDPERSEGWRNLVAIEPELARGNLPLLLYAFAPGSTRGVAVGFDRCLPLPPPPGAVAEALRAKLGDGARGGHAKICLAAGKDSELEALAEEIGSTGAGCERPPSRARAQAELASGRYAAVLLDIADGAAGGLDLACGGQAEGMPPARWIALARRELAATERQRLLEIVAGARTACGAAVVSATRRLLPASGASPDPPPRAVPPPPPA